MSKQANHKPIAHRPNPMHETSTHELSTTPPTPSPSPPPPTSLMIPSSFFSLVVHFFCCHSHCRRRRRRCRSVADRPGAIYFSKPDCDSSPCVPVDRPGTFPSSQSEEHLKIAKSASPLPCPRPLPWIPFLFMISSVLDSADAAAAITTFHRMFRFPLLLLSLRLGFLSFSSSSLPPPPPPPPP